MLKFLDRLFMSLDSQKLELIQMIMGIYDESTLVKVAAFLKDEQLSLAEQQANYGVEAESVVNIEDLSEEFQASIKRGLAQLERGEGISDEEDQKFWDKWFEEN